MTKFPTELTPRILFEDTHLAVIDKPAGLLSQGERTGDLNLVDWLRGHFGRNYVGLVHRLDRNTSGAIIVGKRTKSAQRLTEALQRDQLRRVYLAWVLGDLAAPARWAHALLKDENRNLVRVVAAGTPGAKSASLRVTPLDRARSGTMEITLAEFRLETGRSHQIRAQAAAERHPLLGDSKYLGARAPQEAHAFSRPLLHSWLIEFPHPMSGEVMRFDAPVPNDLRALAPQRDWSPGALTPPAGSSL